MKLTIEIDTLANGVELRGLATRIAELLKLPAEASKNACWVQVSTPERAMADYWQSVYR